MIDIGMLRIRPTTIAIRIRSGRVSLFMCFLLINNKPITKRELVRAVSWGSGTPGTP